MNKSKRPALETFEHGWGLLAGLGAECLLGAGSLLAAARKLPAAFEAAGGWSLRARHSAATSYQLLPACYQLLPACYQLLPAATSPHSSLPGYVATPEREGRAASDQPPAAGSSPPRQAAA